LWHDGVMDDVISTNSTLNINNRWKAKLALDFIEQEGRSYLAKREHTGPLVIQKTLHPEGLAVCHGIIVHPPGGVAGGDDLTLEVNLNNGAHALLTTPGAGKWYKANGQFASQHLNFELKNGACLEWLPQENILFNGAKVRFSANINLDAEANYASWDILCFGRQAQHEVWQTGSLQQHLQIRRAGKLIWNEQSFLVPSSPLMYSIACLNGNAVSASFVIAAGVVPQHLLTTCKAVQPKLALDMQAKYGITALPDIFSARYVGQSAQSARQYFEALWHILRPWYARREVTRPRIWNT
jgi:urease accessory protein